MLIFSCFYSLKKIVFPGHADKRNTGWYKHKMEARNKIKIELAPLCDPYKKKSSRTAVYRETTHVQMCSDSIKCIHTCLSFLKIYKKNGTHINFA